MANCTVTRTHRLGKPLSDRNYGPPVPGPVILSECYNAAMKRNVRTMYINQGREAPNPKPVIPELHDPELLSFCSDRSAVFRGFEEINGQRYYQGWWIRWI